MHSLFKKCKKTHFLNGISSKSFFLKKFLDLINVYQYHAPYKNSPKHSIDNLTFEIHSQIFKLCDKYYLVINIIHTFKFLNVCWKFQND
jgi:hypothetical protein